MLDRPHFHALLEPSAVKLRATLAARRGLAEHVGVPILVFCWPLAILALLLWPIVWLLSLPFRLLGIAVEGVFGFLRALITLPARILRGGAAR